MVFGRGDISQIKEGMHDGFVVHFGEKFEYDKIYKSWYNEGYSGIHSVNPIHLGWVMCIIMSGYKMYKFCTVYEHNRFNYLAFENRYRLGRTRHMICDLDKSMRRMRFEDFEEGEQWMNKWLDKQCKKNARINWVNREWEQKQREKDKKEIERVIGKLTED